MKKLYTITAFILWGFAQMVNAQNMYRNYQSSPNAVPRPTSAVSVVHSNGFVYFFQADDNGNLSATEIDPLSMNPMGNDQYYQLTIPNVSNIEISLNGGFEDAIGKFVLFGAIHYYDNYINQYCQYPAHVIIASNLSTCDVYYDSSSGSEYTAGCDGYIQNMNEAYMMVNGRELVTIDALLPINIHRIELDAATNPTDHYSDVSWDAVHGKFIATGYAWNTSLGYKDPFVKVFELLNYTTINPFAEYCVLNQSYTQSNEYKTLHVQINNDDMILYHDLRRANGQYAYDVIWLTRIHDFWDVNTATVVESMFYDVPNTKLSAKDMLYDPYNKRLNFLGYINHCRDGLTHILAQVDPYMLSSGIEIGQLGATFTGGTCLNDQPPYVDIAYNDLEMFNLALNQYNPCNSVLIAGVGNQQAILTETYDISLSKCDIPMWHADNLASPVLKPYSLNNAFPQSNLQTPTVSVFPDNIAVNILCDEPDACSHQFGGKSLPQPLTNITPAAKITFEPNKLFVCEGFEGTILYSFYDVAGKLLQQGITRNGEKNSLKMYSGVCLLKAMDVMGNQVVKKIILLKS